MRNVRSSTLATPRKVPSSSSRLTLVNRGEVLLQQLPERLTGAAHRSLDGRGIDVARLRAKAEDEVGDAVGFEDGYEEEDGHEAEGNDDSGVRPVKPASINA